MKKVIENFCIFIISYKRAGRVDTINALKKSNYTGDFYIVIGDDDPEKNEYLEIYKDKIVVFNKNDYNWVDLLDNDFDKKGTPVFVRNALYDIAEKLGYEYFLVLDDDYSGFYWICNSEFEFRKTIIKDLNKVIEAILKFYKKTPFKIIAFAQHGDFILGSTTMADYLFSDYIKFKRKVMNCHFCSTKRRVRWLSRLNDDVCTYLYWGNKGDLFITIYMISVQQKMTQQNKGGLTPEYRLFGTYNKSFRAIMVCPSAALIGKLGTKKRRVHHKIKWKLAVPAIIQEVDKKTMEIN